MTTFTRPSGPGAQAGRRSRPATGTGFAPAVDAAISVSGLVRKFGGRPVLDGLDLEVPPGQFVALLGASGCGKSTFLRILAGLDSEIEGDVLVARRRAVAFQSPRLLPWKRVRKNVIFGLPGRPDKDRGLDALGEVGLRDQAAAWPKTLSGGEAQRVALARGRPGAGIAAAGRTIRLARCPNEDESPGSRG